jgi:hypothetical protein
MKSTLAFISCILTPLFVACSDTETGQVSNIDTVDSSTEGGGVGGSGGVDATSSYDASTGGGATDEDASGGSAGEDANDDTGESGGSAGDAARDAGSDTETPSYDGGNVEYPDILFTGVWLVGWIGDLDHFSWVKFTRSAPGQSNGTWATLSSNCAACAPYFHCEGSDGLFSANATDKSLVLQYPLSCSDSGAPGAETWSFTGFHPPAGYPPGAILHAAITKDPTAPGPIGAYLFPATQCTDTFKSCTEPQ